jgi:hypothetical protein
VNAAKDDDNTKINCAVLQAHGGIASSHTVDAHIQKRHGIHSIQTLLTDVQLEKRKLPHTTLHSILK